MGNRILGFTAAITLFVAPASALAQQPAPATPAWDLAVTAGSFHGETAPDPGPGYRDDWHHAAEWRVAAGRYWTPHLKTEVEFGATGEGHRYIQRFTTVPGSAVPIPYSAQDFVRVRQGSARVVWQFLDNQWVHPYLSAGLSVDEERTRTHVYSPIYIPDPRTTYRPGLVLGGGAKWYVSPRLFIKTGAQAGLSRPARSITFLAGMGFDF